VKRVLVTGGTRGIGLAVSDELRRQGWEVLTVARHDADFSFDVGSAWPQLPEVHSLVCAAGVIGTPGEPEEIEDFDAVVRVNLLGTWNAARACLPDIRRNGGSIVTFSGGGATTPFPRFDAYAASKAAVVRLTENLAAAGDVRANSVAPGFVVTGMQDDVLSAGAQRVGQEYFETISRAVAEGGGEDPQLAADLVAWLVSDEAQGISGKLLAAKWDPWRDPGFQERLRTEPDLATLRRIDDQFFTSC
jgi:3-oxoacyl-[acyl-carrier protein] reductase